MWFEEIIQSWDCTFKDTKGTDYVVGQVWGRKGADRYLLDQVRDKMAFPATVRAIKNMKDKWPQSKRILIEDTANGPAVISTLKHDIPGIVPVNPSGGKVVRAQAVTAQIESGNVYIPSQETCSWVGDYIEEFAAFPNGKHDDQVDSTTQALCYMDMKRGGWSFGPDIGAF
jgi:predicted phage terminase large subunit-like protein